MTFYFIFPNLSVFLLAALSNLQSFGTITGKINFSWGELLMWRMNTRAIQDHTL